MDFNNQKVNKENGEAPVKGLLKKCVRELLLYIVLNPSKFI